MNQKELFLISSTVFLTIVAWVVFDLYGIQKSTPTDADIDSVRLDYSIDTNVFEVLRNKIP
ncbi:hypothetical protein KAZ66_02085 [Candidatus Woesebacteria bacterium]|nr:hypothetical protein [Candidatus Woesebacteria bacterium]